MAAPSMKLWIVRHGETAWSLSGRHTSYSDIELTAAGVEKARTVGPLLAGVEFSAVLASPMGRAVKTAELAGYPDPEIDENLAEWNYGGYEGVTTDEIRKTVPGWAIWSHGPDDAGENHEAVAARADQIVDRVRNTAGNILAFGHGHMMRVITARWLGLGSRDGRLFVLDAGAVCVLGYEHEWPAIRAWNTVEK